MLQAKLQQNFITFLKQKEFELQKNSLILEGNNPNKPLEKGYLYAEIVGKKDVIVKSIKDVQDNDTLQLHIIDGTIHANVEKIIPAKK